MKSKICHISCTVYRNDPRVFRKYCVTLAQNGYDVTLLLSKDELQNEVVDNVKIISLRYESTSKLKKLFEIPRMLFRKAVEIDADMYHIHDPALLNIALKLKKRGKKVIIDYCEDYKRLMKYHAWIPRPLKGTFGAFYSLYEKYMLGKFDAIITATPHVTKRLQEINSNITEINNYPIIERHIERHPKRNNICYAGLVSGVYMQENVLQAISKIEDVNYLIAGVKMNEYFDTLEELPGWEHVTYYGNVQYNDLKKIYSESAVGLAIHSYHPNVDYENGTLSINKIFEYMMMGLPVLCSNQVLWKEIIEENKCGISVNPYSVDEIHDAILYLINNPEEAEAMGKNGRHAALLKYNWDNVLSVKLIKLYNVLLANT